MIARALDVDTFVRGLPAESPALLDVRDEHEFAAGHLEGSGHLPVIDLERRRAELPPRDVRVWVVSREARAARDAALRLESMGYGRLAWLDAPLESLGEAAQCLGSRARLWRPNPFLAEVAGSVPRGPAADLAAGSGREATWLALEGFEVEAWDAAPEALERAEDLARHEGVRVTGVVANLELGRPPLPLARWALVTCFRFLHRGLLPAMAGSLRPGGHLVYETYRVGQERFGRPRRAQFLLEPGELARRFESLGLEILRFEEPDPPGGPISSRLWARRP
jgi:rhodanese-related sulfurtransferase